MQVYVSFSLLIFKVVILSQVGTGAVGLVLSGTCDRKGAARGRKYIPPSVLLPY